MDAADAALCLFPLLQCLSRPHRQAAGAEEGATCPTATTKNVGRLDSLGPQDLTTKARLHTHRHPRHQHTMRHVSSSSIACRGPVILLRLHLSNRRSFYCCPAGETRSFIKRFTTADTVVEQPLLRARVCKSLFIRSDHTYEGLHAFYGRHADV